MIADERITWERALVYSWGWRYGDTQSTFVAPIPNSFLIKGKEQIVGAYDHNKMWDLELKLTLAVVEDICDTISITCGCYDDADYMAENNGELPMIQPIENNDAPECCSRCYDEIAHYYSGQESAASINNMIGYCARDFPNRATRLVRSSYHDYVDFWSSLKHGDLITVPTEIRWIHYYSQESN